MPNVLSPRDLVSRPDNMDETVLSSSSSSMLHAKFQDHKNSGSGEDFNRFNHICAWRPSCSCVLDHLYKLSFPLPKEAPHKIWP